MEKILDTSFTSAKMELSHADFIGNDILLYDDIRKAPIPAGPRRMTFIFIALCTEGSARYAIDTVVKEVRKNDVVIISERHVVESLSGSASLRGLCMVMSMDFYHETVRNVSDISAMLIFAKATPVVSLTEREAEVFKGYFRMLKAKTAETEHPFRRKVVQALVLAMFYDLSGVVSRLKAAAEGHSPRAEAIFTDFIRLVEAHFKSERRVAWYAAQMCITPKYLAETVRQVSRRTPNEWIDNYVTLELRLMLKNSSKSIKEIATEMNFPNQSFLGKYFREHVGLSPSAYRRSNAR